MGGDLTVRLPLILICVGLGILLTWQAPMNAEAARRLSSPVLAALLSLTISLSLVAMATLATLRTAPTMASLGGAPWWMWIGGFCGAVFLIASLMIVPRIGTVMFLLAVIFGQMIGAIVADCYGLFGLPAQPLSMGKVAGAAIVLIGAAVYQLSE
jgi:bacterial/archaeal transporter family-2 protein